jgi:predicted nucleic acid-binding protein
MAFLTDTNVLGRLANRADAFYPIAKAAVTELHHRGETLCLTSQVLVEFRNIATRPVTANGLGLTVSTAEALATDYETNFPLLEETPDIFPAWKAIVTSLGVIGKQVHDARLVAVCHVHAVTHLLTFNVAHFVQWRHSGLAS